MVTQYGVASQVCEVFSGGKMEGNGRKPALQTVCRAVFPEGGHSCPPFGGLDAGWVAGWKTRPPFCVPARAPSLFRKTEMRR